MAYQVSSVNMAINLRVTNWSNLMILKYNLIIGDIIALGYWNFVAVHK